MAVTSQVPRNVSTATAGATVFPYSFKIVSQGDLLVEVDGVTKAAGVDYTVSGVGQGAGGDVTFLVAMDGGETVVRKRNMAFERLTDYQHLGDLRSPTLNNDQDEPILMIQQVDEEVKRSFRLPIDVVGVNLELPAPDALHPLVWSASGTALENGDIFGTGDMLLRPDLQSSASGKGASLVRVRDDIGELAGLNAEDALKELAIRNGRPQTLNEVRKAMADGSTVKIVCIGDSITYGQLDTGGLAAIPYPLRLQNLLREYYDNLNITVVNKGIAGSTSQDMLDRFATDVTAENPDLVIFNSGQNDSRPPSAVTITSYNTNLNTYLAQCQPRPVIVLGVTPRAFENLGSNVVDYYRRNLGTVAKARNLTYVDANARFERMFKSRAQARGRISLDGAHLSEEGYRYLGDIVFCEALVNDDLYIRPGEFKDASGQWIFNKEGVYLLAGTNHQDAKSLTMGTDGNGGTAKLYLFVEDWDECDLVAHVTVNSNTAGQQIRITDISTGGVVTIPLTPTAAGGAWYALDYPVVALRLRPGINNILLASVSNSQWAVNGFSVKARKGTIDRGNYLATYNEASDKNQLTDFFTSATYGAGGLFGFDTMRPGPLVVSSGTKIARACYLEPFATTEYSSRWRWRATVYPNTTFHFGQQSNNNVDYMPVFSLVLDGTNALVRCRDATNTQRTLATVALAVAGGGANVKVDLNSTASGWAIYVNDTLIHTETVPLSIGPLLVQSSAGNPVYLNPPIHRLQGTAFNDVLRGESWVTFTDDKLHIIGGAGTDKAVTFV